MAKITYVISFHCMSGGFQLWDTYVSCNKSEQWVGEKYVLCSETANTLQY